jgi:hypothetical protein
MENVHGVMDRVEIAGSEKTEPKPIYMCPGCSNHTYSNNMVKRMQYSIKQSNISYIITRRSEKDYINAAEN